MNEYHKIQTVFKRNPKTDYKTLLMGEYSLPEFKYLKNNRWVFTEKVDGTNIRIQYSDNLSFKGKTDKATIPGHLLEVLKATFTEKKFREIFYSITEEDVPPICLYGEGCGPKIQKGGENYGTDPKFVLLDIKVGNWWLQRKDIESIAKKFEVDVIPIIGIGNLLEMIDRVRNTFASTWGDFLAEGIVARPEVELKCRNGKRIITKLKCKDFQR